MSVLYIVNPISGNGKKRRIVSHLKGRVEFTRYAGHAEILAREASEDTVVAVGGDGTVNEVARGLVGTGKTLGIIPCGSGDGLARCLGITAANALRVIEGGKTRALDWGTIDSKPFFSVCGVGIDAMVSERFASAGKRGLRTYIREALGLWKTFEPSEYELTVDGQRQLLKAAIITVGNSNQWGNNARITPLADPGDGLLDITVIRPFRTADIPALVLRLFLGNIHRSRKALCLKGKDIRIVRPSEGAAHFDGDCFSAGKELTVRISDSPLKVLASE